MEFEWDDAKRQSNMRKHRLDFIDAVVIFEAPHVITDARSVGDERRFMATGWMDDGFVTVVFTKRGTAIRIISVRSARNVEQRRYKAVHG